MHRASSYNIYINQQAAQNSCDQTLFSTGCSTYFGLYQSIIRSNIYKLYIAFGICRTYRHIQKIKSHHKNFVHLVGLYTSCKMMHGSYNIKIMTTFPEICTVLSRILLSHNQALYSLLAPKINNVIQCTYSDTFLTLNGFFFLLKHNFAETTPFSTPVKNLK